MKKVKITYWITTGLLAAMMLLSAIPGIMGSPDSVAFFRQLGYPDYLLMFLSIAKLLGAIVVLIPGFPRLKEWVYAGFTYDLIGAFYSCIAIGLPIVGCIPILIGLALVAASYIMHHKLLGTHQS